MQGSVEDLADHLYRLFTGGEQAGIVSSESEQGGQVVVPAQLFAIIENVLEALTPEEKERQVASTMTHLVRDVSAFENKSETTASLVAGATPSRLCVTVLTSCALLALSPTVGSSAQSLMRTWETCVLQLFTANPPVSEAVMACAAYGVARLTLQQWGQSEKVVLSAACAAVQRLAPSLSSLSSSSPSSTAPAQMWAVSSSAAAASPVVQVDISIAVEVLAQIASLLALDRPVQLSGVLPAPPSHAQASSSGKSRGKQTKKETSNGKAKETAKRESAGSPSSQVPPTCSETNPLERSVFCHALDVTEATVHDVREGIIRACLYALGGEEAGVEGRLTASAAGAQNAHALSGRRDQELSSRLCRRVLIPLLLLNGDDTLLTYEPVVQRLLCSLGGMPDAEDVASDEPLAALTDTETTPNAVSEEAPNNNSNKNNNGEAEERRGEVVVLTAALFDFLFRSPNLDESSDYRFSPFLWRTLHAALYDAIATPHLDAGRRANMQLRVEYLLKRLVDLTSKQETAATAGHAFPPMIVFHRELFVWLTRAGSAASSTQSWGYFFLVLEALNEFGWHIIQPALVKLDALVKELQTALESQGQSTTPLVTPLASAWIELLHLKLILHPNLGVRKVGLRRVWRLPACVLATFSHKFLFTHVLESATDPRLCVELDRTPVTATFLETKAFEGQEVCAVPDLEPLAHEVEHFYARLFLHDLNSAALRTAAMRRMLRSLLHKPPRFTVSVAVRTLHYLAQQLLVEEAGQPEKQAWTCAMMLDDEVLTSLGVFLRDSIQENIPFWLDVRVTAILFSTFLHFAALSPRAFRGDARYWRLLCLCGPLGQSGGKSIARMDACGSSYGSVGSSLDPTFLHAKVAHFVLKELPSAYAPTTEAKTQFLVDLLWLDTLPERTRVLLAASSSSTGFDEIAIKQHFFLLGAPLAFHAMCTADEDAAGSEMAAVAKPEWLLQTCADVAECLVSLRRRAYPGLSTVLTAVACLVALEQTLSPRHAIAYFDSDALAEMLEAVRGCANRALDTAYTRMTLVTSAEELSGHAGTALALAEVGVTEEVVAAWATMHTDVWDVVTSGITSLHKLLTRHALSGTTTEAEGWASHGSAEAVCRLVRLIQSCGTVFAQQSGQGGSSTADGNAGATATDVTVQADLARQAAQLVVARNASRLLLNELCGLLFTEVDEVVSEESESTGEDAEAKQNVPRLSRDAGDYRGLFPASVEGSLRHVRNGIPGLSPQKALELIAGLTQTLTQRLTTSALPLVLSGLPWPTLLAQHSRAVYNVIYILAEDLGPSATRHGVDHRHAHATTTEPTEPTLADVARAMARESLVPLLESFAMDQLEQCWSSCLPSVMDLLVLVTATNDPRVDYAAVVDAVFSHVHDVGARQHARASALAFSVLLFALPHVPEHVHHVLMRTLQTEVEATDRNVYFAAVTACLGVLQSPTQYYDVLKDVLVQCAVLYNSGRDEEENESTMATTEPLLQSWPEALRTRYPPTVRLSAVGRAFCLSTLLWCCASDSEKLRPVELATQLLRMNTRDPIVTHEPCMPNSQTHRTRLRLWQLLCALLPTLPCSDLDKVTPLFQILLEECVPINNMGSVRRFMELFAIRLLEEQPSLYTLVADALGDYALRPQVCGTFVLVASHALLHDQRQLPSLLPSSAAPTEVSSCEVSLSSSLVAAPRDGRTPLFNALFPRLLQQSTSNQHLLRIISHIGLFMVCRARLASGRPVPVEAAAIYDYIVRAPEHVKLREKHVEMLFFDTHTACTPRSLFCVQRKEANTILQEHVPAAAFERIRFLETELDCLIGAVQPMELLRVRLLSEALATPTLLDRFRTFSLIPHTRKRADYYVDYTAEATRMLVTDPLASASPDLSAAGAEDDIQKKVTSWWNCAVYNELHPRAVQRQTRQSIVIVGSLLENPVNIAGLCRCGEIFAVERITIPERKVFDHPHFVATARSAELWIPWQEVAPKDLPTYLIAMREEGYVIVGIEQTASSVSIADFAFPERVVVVLGAEGQGVPAPLIPLLDVCVEIPQYGLIRSLNVHVTGAIAMFEYTRQHLMTTSTSSASAQ